MQTRNKNVKTLVIFSLLVCAYSMSFAQDYYGGGPPPGGWRRRPNQQQQPRDKEDKGNPEPSGYSSVNFGFANPEGAFASPFGSGYGGYALPGSVLHISFAVPLGHSNFGLAFMFGSYNNEYDLNNYINYLSNSSTSNAYGPVTEGVNNVYSESSILGGLFVTIPIGRLSIDGRLMAGALLNSLPEQAYGKQDTAGNVSVYDLQTSYPTSLAFDVGIGVRCLIAKFGRRQVCAMVNVDYLYSNVSYNTTQEEDDTPYNSNPNNQVTYIYYNQVSGHLPISLFNITFGIGYQFGGGE
jgi:hypothetical protein